MLPGGGDQSYRRILESSGRHSCDVEVWRSGVRVDDGTLMPLSGSVSATMASRVSRQLRVKFAAPFPWDGGVLDPLGNEIRVFCSWTGGAEPPQRFQVFRGPITSVEWRYGDTSVDVGASDLAELVVADAFTEPYTVVAGTQAALVVKQLIKGTILDAEFGEFDDIYAEMPAVTWDSDRARALDEVTSASNAFWYALPDGRFVMRRIPWASATPTTPVVEYHHNIDEDLVLSPTSTSLLEATVSTSRDGVFNTVRVTGEAPTGGEPVSGTVTNTLPGSRTSSLGPLGRRVRQIRRDAARTSAQAQYLARSDMQRLSAPTLGLSTVQVADPALELGDFARIVLGGRSIVQAVESFTLALTGTRPTMNVRWRASASEVSEVD